MNHRSRLAPYQVKLIIVAIILVVIGFVCWSVARSLNKLVESSAQSDEVVWAYDEKKNEWFAKSGTPSACKTPFKFDRSPVDMSHVTAVLFPGAYRGYSYKPHGGFGTTESLGGKVEVKMPMDATLVGLTRYYEGNPPDLQYLLTFESDCGIAFRFDHLYKLSPELQALADKTPEPKLNDTRTNPNDNPPRTKFKSGQVVATEVGLQSMKIYGFDFGVYDYRQQNEISKNRSWAAIHNQYQSLDWYGVCWFDMLPGDGPDIAKQQSMKQYDTRRTVPKISDYCTNAPHKTLEFNDGKPTDG